jgi:molybdopterin/thiamine biosynthesis adenylyltransferase
MNEATLVLPQEIARDIARAARTDIEVAAVILVGAADTRAGLRLLTREIHWVPADCYQRQTYNSLSISSHGFVPALRRAEELSATPVFLHTHPGDDADPRPSKWDDIVDEQLADTFRIRSGSDRYASLVFSPAQRLFRFSGRGLDGDRPFEVRRILVAGDRIALLTSVNGDANSELSPIFDRQIRAFGSKVQRVLSSLRIAVIGCGGTGSAVAEQLVRLGVRSLVLVDNDDLNESNLTRVYGSNPSGLGEPKVNVLANHLLQIAPDLDVTAIKKLVTDELTARRLTDCDALFGCTDDNAGRLVLARLASYYLVPLVDCGVLISSTSGTINGIDGRVTVQTPGAACLVCRNRVDLARAAAEQLDPGERRLRQDEGYAPELGRVEPAVVTYTSQVAGQAVSELLERIIGYGPEPVPTEVLLRFHDREISTNIQSPKTGHFCHPVDGWLGRGDSEPFLGQLWRSP